MPYNLVDKKRALSAAFVKGVRYSGKPYGPDKYHDDHGLILRVIPTGGKQWIWRGTVHGNRIDLGLGGWPYVSLAEARQTAFEYRKLARAGGDPRSLRPGQGVPTFAEAAKTVIGIHEPGWRDGGKTAAQWRASLRDYAIPRLGKLRVSNISTADVMAVLLPIWNEKRETARRVRQRIGAIMKWAVAARLSPGQSCWRRHRCCTAEERRFQEAPSRPAACRSQGRHHHGAGVARSLGNSRRHRVPHPDRLALWRGEESPME